MKNSRFDRQVKLALVYAREHDDFHVEDLKEHLNIRRGRYEDGAVLRIMRDVKDLAPFEVWPVYERPGWWTSRPSHEVRVFALYMSAARNATEQERNNLVMQRHNQGSALAGTVKLAAKQARGVKEFYEDDVPNPERQHDHCLMRIDKLMALRGG